MGLLFVFPVTFIIFPQYLSLLFSSLLQSVHILILVLVNLCANLSLCMLYFYIVT